MTRRAPALALVVVAAGCSVSVGGYVGKHVARTNVDVEACLVDDYGRCTEKKQIVTHLPARHFWGAIVAFPALGAASVTAGDKTETGIRAEPSLEVLSGNGRYAWGVRGSFLLDDQSTSVPVMAMGHISLAPRLGVYAGLGYAPWARLARDHMPELTSSNNERALVGVQIALQRIMVLSVEAVTLWLGFDGGYRSFGFTGHLGFFL